VKINPFPVACTSLVLLLSTILAACSDSQDNTLIETDGEMHQVPKLTYPVTKKDDIVDDYFGTPVKDPYRWLEDDMSAETGAWVSAQNVVTDGYLEKIPFRDEIKVRLEEMWNYEKVGAPFKEGNYTYFYRNQDCKINMFCTELMKLGTQKSF